MTAPRGAAAALAAALLLAACAGDTPEAPPGDAVEWTPVAFSALPGWAEDRHDEAAAALAKSCAALARQPDSRSLGAGGLAGTAGDWRSLCGALPPPGSGAGRAAARAFFERWFTPYAAAADGLFTGYYEPTLAASRQRSEHYATPLYARPPDLVSVALGDFRPELAGERIAGRAIDGRLRPYPSRREIAAGGLDGKGLEIAWVADPVDAFFLHIQGSGRLALDDGGALRVGYDGQNGHPYTAIGRVLVDEGALAREDVSMQSIRAWLAANPGEAERVMNANSSYVFFRMLADGPVGAQGVVLTPGRSLAVDRRFVPLSVPVWLDTQAPLPDGSGAAPLRRLAIAQDTGGAIRGPIRGDVFWGAGEDAAAIAGRMNSRGRYYLLLPKTLTPAA